MNPSRRRRRRRGEEKRISFSLLIYSGDTAYRPTTTTTRTGATNWQDNIVSIWSWSEPVLHFAQAKTTRHIASCRREYFEQKILRPVSSPALKKKKKKNNAWFSEFESWTRNSFHSTHEYGWSQAVETESACGRSQTLLYISLTPWVDGSDKNWTGLATVPVESNQKGSFYTIRVIIWKNSEQQINRGIIHHHLLVNGGE